MGTGLPLHTNHLSKETAFSFCNPRIVYSLFYQVTRRTSPGALGLADGGCEESKSRASLAAKAKRSFSR